MTICGKPSKSCERCRGKKIKCDEIKPVCTRCQKGGHSCFYRDANDILFRNQTSQTTKRAQEKWRSRATKGLRPEGVTKNRQASSSTSLVKSTSASPGASKAIAVIPAGPETALSSSSTRSYASATTSASPGTISSTTVTPQSTTDADSYTPSSTQTLPSAYPQVDKVIIHRFFCDYVVVDSDYSGGYLEYLPRIYYQTPAPSCLNMAVAAVSLANMASLVNDQAMKDYASSIYADAIHSMNTALHTTNEVIKDETLLATYLLSFYENIACEKQQESSWQTHIAGAVSILTLRDESEFFSPTAFKIFRLIHSKTLVAALWAHQAPVIPLEMWTRHYTSAPILYRLMLLLHHTATIRASLRQVREQSSNMNNPATREKIEEILSQAKALEVDFRTWVENLDLRWAYNTKEWKDCLPSERNVPSLNIPGSPAIRHEYLHFVIASLWNLFRGSRLLLHQAIRQCIVTLAEPPNPNPTDFSQSRSRWLPDPKRSIYEAQYASSTTIAIQMLDDISATVDFHFSSSQPASGTTQSMDINGHNQAPSPGSTYSQNVSNPTTPLPFTTHKPSSQEPWTGRALRGYVLLFPLWAALEEEKQKPALIFQAETMLLDSTASRAEDVKSRTDWVKRVLEYIHISLGIAQAGAIGEWSLGT